MLTCDFQDNNFLVPGRSWGRYEKVYLVCLENFFKTFLSVYDVCNIFRIDSLVLCLVSCIIPESKALLLTSCTNSSTYCNISTVSLFKTFWYLRPCTRIVPWSRDTVADRTLSHTDSSSIHRGGLISSGCVRKRREGNAGRCVRIYICDETRLPRLGAEPRRGQITEGTKEPLSLSM